LIIVLIRLILSGTKLIFLGVKDEQQIKKNICHCFIKYRYKSGENFIVNKIYNHKFINIHYEYIIPHIIVARVIFGYLLSNIITNALTISKFKTRLIVKAYCTF